MAILCCVAKKAASVAQYGIFFMSKSNFLWLQSLTRIRIRMNQHLFGSLDPDPQHCYKLISVFHTGGPRIPSNCDSLKELLNIIYAH